MTAGLVATLLAACGSEGGAPEDPAERLMSLGVVERIKGPDGGYDYASVDPDTNRLFVAREFGVMAVDLANGRVSERVIEANDVSAVLPLPNGFMLSTIYGDDRIVLFDRRTGTQVATLPAGKSPDAAAFDPSSGLAFVMNAKSNDITVVDVAKRAVIGTIPVGGKPEAAVSDGKGRLYVNVEDTAEIAVVDIGQRKVAARFELPGCKEPTGIAFDATTRLLISACHNGVAKLIDSAAGADRGTVAIGMDADGAIFEAGRRSAYIPAKDGTLTVFQLDKAGKAGNVRKVSTEPGARTAAVDPRTGRIYLPASAFVKDAAGEETQVPGSFKILVVAEQ